MDAPTKPVPLKERVTSRSTIGGGSGVVAGLVTLLTDIGPNLDPQHSLITMGIGAAIFAVGYVRDIAMAYIEARAEAMGVDWKKAEAIADRYEAAMPEPDFGGELDDRAGGMEL